MTPPNRQEDGGGADGDRVGAEGWKRLAESQQALAEAGRRIKEISEKYGLDGDGVARLDGSQP